MKKSTTAAKTSTTAAKITTVVEKIAATTKPIVSNRQIVTNSVNGKLQQRTIGSRRVKNNWGHYEGTIAHDIDIMILNENFTKKQMCAYAGTKMSRINAHINHLRKVKKCSVTIDAVTKIVRFA